MTHQQVVQVEFVSARPGEDLMLQVRAMLKQALRQHGLRCIAVRLIPPEAPLKVLPGSAGMRVSSGQVPLKFHHPDF